MHSQFHLLRTRRFLPLFLTQFLGALNDNSYKNALVVLLTFQAASWTTMAPGVLANLAAGIFILPFFLFSATAGQLADKFDKARLTRLVKLAEVAIMLLASLGFAAHNLELLLLALFLMGLHSTFFGPIKYALLPQHLAPEELVSGNAFVEAGTFVAILLGTLLGGVLAAAEGGTIWVSLCVVTIAVGGYLSCRQIPAAPAPVPDLKLGFNPFTETWRNIGFARENRSVFLAILGISWFWLYGALFLANFPAYAKGVLGGGESSVTLLLSVFTVGIGLGSMACDKLSNHRVEAGLVPIGALGLTLFGLDFAWASPASSATGTPLPLETLLTDGHVWRILADLLLLGGCGGFYCVPLYALMQERSSESHRARTIAANNIMNALFIVVGSLAAAALLGTGLSIAALIGFAALANGLVAIYIFSVVPEFLLRLVKRLKGTA